MAGRFQMITDLYRQAVQEVTKSTENWTSFLQSASRNYRLPFDEQLLIHVQRPDATAVLRIEHWNRRFGRWIKKGSKGIAVLDKSRGQIGLKYYFDISDTKESRNPSLVRPVPLWEVRAEHQEEIKETLTNAFSTGDLGELDNTILTASRYITEENIPDYLPDILAETEHSSLDGLDELNIDLKVRTVLENSIAYMTMTRCGCDLSAYFQEDDFSHVLSFDTPELVNLLGTAVSEIGQIPLREIADTMNKHMHHKKRRYRTFAYTSGREYSVGVRLGKQKEGKENGRDQIQYLRRVSDSQSDCAGGTNGKWEVRITTQEIFEGEPLRKISESVHPGEIKSVPATDTEGRSDPYGGTYSADGAGSGRDGGSQGRESDGVGREDEQHPADSGGTRAEGTDLQVNKEKEQLLEKSDSDSLPDFPLLPTESEQLSLIDIGFELQNELGEPELSMLQPVEKQRGPSKTRLEDFCLYPEIPQEERNQYRITNDKLGYGTPREKFRANMDAIQMLKKCETEGRLATIDEQEILSGYVGWGGLSDVFDETRTAWSKEYLELKTMLTPEEYAAARESTLTAFYTPPFVIGAMYQVLENMGLKSGNILEPSCGIGNFIGMKPESLADCKIYGVEIDTISARIAGQLYQKSHIVAKGYEDVELPDSFFDIIIGNVPFGQFKVSDKRYDKYKLLIHDYFFVKALDKIRPGGVIAFITSSGTMDKKNSSVRKYLAERAELLGAIRLPNDTFQKNAGTKVTSDILFLQKKECQTVEEPDWLYLADDSDGISINQYFMEHPEMILGEMVMESSRFGGMESTCRSKDGVSLKSQLEEVIQRIHAEFVNFESEELVEEDDQSIPADPEAANFSFTIKDGKIYYRENSRMAPVELSVTGQNRVRGMIGIRDSVRKLIEYQTEDYPDIDIQRERENLNRLYDSYQKKYGLLNSRGNSMAFSEDGSYPLLCSLEIIKEDGTLERKADMFYKRTIKPDLTVNQVDTVEKALAVSLGECAEVNMERMEQLCGKSADEIEQELSGVIFRLPEAGSNPVFVTADEYLSGDVRQKLKMAKTACEKSEIYRVNVEALEKIQPEDLSAAEIKVRLGTTWIPASDFQDFMYELLETSEINKDFIKVHYSEITSQWNIEGKSREKGNIRASNTYGTKRANAYRILEDSLNLRDTQIYDYIKDENGNKKAILNKQETAAAQGKQEAIRQAFEEWIWKDPERRERLVRHYNDTFNAIRTREYDGSHLEFPGMNPEIRLRTHQRNAIARIIYGGNTLLAHVVGAGKTYTMVAAAMKMKQMGLCHKSMIVVPNHIIEQFAAEWLQLYPSANILIAAKKSFEKKNRKKFCARIATGEYDAVIIGHSQFEKIPVSTERQRRMLERQRDEILEGINEVKGMEGGKYTVKQLEKTRKSLDKKLEKLNDSASKDDMITFEQLGIDRLFVDEADNYKNLFLYTKMRNVGGIAQTDAQKSSDMYMKCRYMDELTGGKGIIFATGTPVSNSMVELYTLQRYLQYELLKMYNLIHFDCWASMFGETVNAMELAPEGTGYRLKTRFSKFNNIPEMMKMFKEVADIQTEDMLNLPVPKANYRVVAVKPTEAQKEMVEKLAKRAERVRNGMVDPKVDNMLKITNDGRKLALDQRIINDLLPDETQSKVNACVREVVAFWKQGKDKKLTQLVFSDLSTPKEDGSFNVYDDLRKKLEQAGIPKEEIVFIHEADTDVKKKALFAKVRNGSVRVLIGSTFKMGAGTNVQDLIIASHDLDVPWRPRDVGQILRTFKIKKNVEVTDNGKDDF